MKIRWKRQVERVGYECHFTALDWSCSSHKRGRLSGSSTAQQDQVWRDPQESIHTKHILGEYTSGYPLFVAISWTPISRWRAFGFFFTLRWPWVLNQQVLSGENWDIFIKSTCWLKLKSQEAPSRRWRTSSGLSNCLLIVSYPGYRDTSTKILVFSISSLILSIKFTFSFPFSFPKKCGCYSALQI